MIQGTGHSKYFDQEYSSAAINCKLKLTKTFVNLKIYKKNHTLQTQTTKQNVKYLNNKSNSKNLNSAQLPVYLTRTVHNLQH